MFCEKCGNEMSETAAFCSKCGWSKAGTKVSEPTSNVNRTSVSQNHNSVSSDDRPQNVMGIAGFVLGILSVIFFWSYGFLIGIVGLVLSLIANKKKDMYKETRLIKVGIILSIIGMAATCIFTAILAPSMLKAM